MNHKTNWVFVMPLAQELAGELKWPVAPKYANQAMAILSKKKLKNIKRNSQYYKQLKRAHKAFVRAARKDSPS